MKLKGDLPQLYFVTIIDLFTTNCPPCEILWFSTSPTTAINNYEPASFLGICTRRWRRISPEIFIVIQMVLLQKLLCGTSNIDAGVLKWMRLRVYTCIDGVHCWSKKGNNFTLKNNLKIYNVKDIRSTYNLWYLIINRMLRLANINFTKTRTSVWN